MCSHGWHGHEVIEDDGVLEVNNGSMLRARGRGQRSAPGP
jgi:hypothetical protein